MSRPSSPSPKGSTAKVASRNPQVDALIKRLRSRPSFIGVLDHHALTTPQFERIVDSTPLKRSRQSSSPRNVPASPPSPANLSRPSSPIRLSLDSSPVHEPIQSTPIVKRLKSIGFCTENTVFLLDYLLSFPAHESMSTILVLLLSIKSTPRKVLPIDTLS
ncbi:hypothetical protein RCL1_007965 [Eukaryota sp. TZLM3-RCL]